MSLSRLRSDLMRTLRTTAADGELARAQAHREELRAYPTVLSVLLEMQDQSPERYPQRDLLTRVLVAEAQASQPAVWTSALVVAYLPMLIRLRGRLVSDTIARSDLDQIVLEAFIEVVARFPLEKRRDRTAMRLRQETQRAVFKALAADRKEHAELRRLVDDVTRAPDLELLRPSEPEVLSEEDRGELERALRQHLYASGDAAVCDLVCRTTLGGERLVSYVRRLHPTASEGELRRVYNRLKRRRERALARVRRSIEGRRGAAEPERALEAA